MRPGAAEISHSTRDPGRKGNPSAASPVWWKPEHERIGVQVLCQLPKGVTINASGPFFAQRQRNRGAIRIPL